MDLTCAHCGEPWEVFGFRHEAYAYLNDTTPMSDVLFQQYAECWEAVDSWIDHSDFGDPEPEWLSDKLTAFGQKVFELTATGKGCPACGFKHQGVGSYREEQLRELFYDGVTDEDPIDFL